MRDDAAAVRSYLGVKEGEAIPTRAHEKFARSFERYFMEGRAPSRALAGVFGQFRAWLTSIYQTVAKLRAPITDDIRDVFDRLLTTEQDRQPAIVPEEKAGPAPDQMAEPAGAAPAPAAEAPSNQHLFEKAKEPERLASYLVRHGGIQDVGGDVRHTLGGAKYRPGLINAGGMPLDEATERAWEAGYFPDHGDVRPEINDLLNALDGDLKGYEPRYSHDDAEALARFQEVQASNAEIDRLADFYDVDTKGMTRQQFFDTISEHLVRRAAGG